METKNQTQQLNSSLTSNQVKQGVAAFLADNAKLEIWTPIFNYLNSAIHSDQPISVHAQKSINTYLEKVKDAEHPLRSIINAHKQLICIISDLLVKNKEESIEQILDQGLAGQRILNKLNKSDDPCFIKCVEAVSTCFCLFLEKYQNTGKVFSIRRAVWTTLQQKKDWFVTQKSMMEEIFSQPLFLLEGFLDNIKPMIFNYINTESLLEITSPNFNQKKAVLSRIHKGQKKMQAKIINVKEIFGTNCIGRESVERKLKDIEAQEFEGWSLLTCLSQYQQKAHLVFEKLPKIIRVNSNGDMFSFLRTQYFPVFKYQIISANFIQMPILTQFVTIFFNAGKVPFEIISMGESQNILSSISSPFQLYNNIDGLDVKYGKVQVQPRNICVVPAGHYYMIYLNPKHAQSSNFAQILHWDMLSKHQSQVFNYIETLEKKRNINCQYIGVPYRLMLLDYLSHQYLMEENRSFLTRISDYLDKHFLEEEKKCLQLSKDKQIKQRTLSPQCKFCQKCFKEILNCFYIHEDQQILCANCVQPTDNFDSYINYAINSIRYPIILVRLLTEKNMAPKLDHQNKYEESICYGCFLGSVESEACQGSIDNKPSTEQDHIMRNTNAESKFLANTLLNFGIKNFQNQFIQMVIREPKGQEEKDELIVKINKMAGSIFDKQKLRKKICKKYETNNLVMHGMIALGF